MAYRILSAAAFACLAFAASAQAQEVKEIRPTGRPISIEAGHGTALQTSAPMATVFVANQDVADVQLTANQADVAYVFAKKPGTTAVYGLDANGKVVMSATVSVPQRDIKVMRGGTVTVWKRDDPASGGSGTDISQLPAGSSVTIPAGGFAPR